MLKAGLDAEQAFVGNQAGDAKAALAGAAKKVEAVYAYPFQNHACMEPMNATVRYTADRCEVWGRRRTAKRRSRPCRRPPACRPTSATSTRSCSAAASAGAAPSQDYVTQAVLIAKQMPGTPVKLLWSREEDMAHGPLPPGDAVQAHGRPGRQRQPCRRCTCGCRASRSSRRCARRSSRSRRGATRSPSRACSTSGEHSFGYTIPNLLIDHAMRNTHVPPGFWRGVNINQNAVFIECFMDELADAAGQDPLEFRRKLMAKHPRNLARAERGGRDASAGTSRRPQGIHRGLAQMKAFDSFVAAACEISVKDGNKVKVHRIVAATDPGYAVNPAQIERQVAGSFVYGLSALFMQECTVKDGRIEQTTSTPTDSMRIAQMPKVETIIIQGGGTVWGGIGEPTICVAAPAVLNALYQATGKRYPLGAAEEPRARAWCEGLRGRVFCVFSGNGFCER